jgi:ABC-type Co2+ transport system permease subunit
MTASNWYTLSAAVGLLTLAMLNNPWVTLIAAAIGIVAGLILVSRGPLGRSGVFAFIGCVIAAALAVFSLLR